MKRKFPSASVEDVDPYTEEPIPSTHSSASISPPRHESHLRRKIWRQSGEQHMYECRDSADLGPVLDVLATTELDILTIFAGEHEDNKQVWADFEKASREKAKKHRIFYLEDDIVNGESKTYIARTIPVSAAHDLSASNPSVIIAQRRISPSTGDVLLQAHKLAFGAQQIDLDRPYIFSKLGDEMPGIGCADLHVTFRSVRDWDSVLKRGSFGGWDRDVVVDVAAGDVEGGKRIVWDFERGCRVEEEKEKSWFGIAVEARELKGLLGEGEGGGYPSVPGKRKKSEEKGVVKSLCVKLIGIGPQIPGHSVRADINVSFVLKA